MRARTLLRFGAEVAFISLVAVVAHLADLSTAAIIIVMAVAWLLTAIAEGLVSRGWQGAATFVPPVRPFTGSVEHREPPPTWESSIAPPEEITPAWLESAEVLGVHVAGFEPVAGEEEDVQRPEPEAEPESAAVAEVEPVVEVEPEPEPVVEVEPEPAPEVEPEPEPVVEAEPEPVAEVEAEPVAEEAPVAEPAEEREAVAEEEPVVAEIEEPEPVEQPEAEAPVAEVETGDEAVREEADRPSRSVRGRLSRRPRTRAARAARPPEEARDEPAAVTFPEPVSETVSEPVSETIFEPVFATVSETEPVEAVVAEVPVEAEPEAMPSADRRWPWHRPRAEPDRDRAALLGDSEAQSELPLFEVPERLCRSCGKPISKERLRAIPNATQCIDCKRAGRPELADIPDFEALSQAEAAADLAAQAELGPLPVAEAERTREPGPEPVATEPEPEPEPEPKPARGRARGARRGRVPSEPVAAVPEPEPEPEPKPARGRARGARRGRVPSEPVAAVPEPERKPEPEPEVDLDVELVAAAAEPEPEPPAEREPVGAPVAHSAFSPSTREWNVWELERLARRVGGSDAARDEEWAFLLVYLREFANPEGALPSDFDALVRESFPELVAVAETT